MCPDSLASCRSAGTTHDSAFSRPKVPWWEIIPFSSRRFGGDRWRVGWLHRRGHLDYWPFMGVALVHSRTPVAEPGSSVVVFYFAHPISYDQLAGYRPSGYRSDSGYDAERRGA
jgi:hypothetical protein